MFSFITYQQSGGVLNIDNFNNVVIKRNNFTSIDRKNNQTLFKGGSIYISGSKANNVTIA